ncbi:hypothetical protein GQ55_4G265900 [Panicum hallii var. hallii]|uniref:Uncharacterized protein n=1 Tax=Panicum hallii var. hallii TaxID=1504633 RepID=A0A2T7E0E0_9POAL|nr:hypothetical protein GQ55_4G265900 [Panicum hallii var. hallii]
MDKRKIKRRKLALMLIVSCATYVTSCMVVLFVMSRVQSKRKRITYGPMEERDKSRIDYLNIKIYKDNIASTKMIRFKRKLFFRLCQLLRERTLLRDTVHVCIEE